MKNHKHSQSLFSVFIYLLSFEFFAILAVWFNDLSAKSTLLTKGEAKALILARSPNMGAFSHFDFAITVIPKHFLSD
jgi:hypothetical protein